MVFSCAAGEPGGVVACTTESEGAGAVGRLFCFRIAIRIGLVITNAGSLLFIESFIVLLGADMFFCLLCCPPG